MSLRLNTNTDALRAVNALSRTQAAISQSFARLSSGYRINSAADDAAGLSISERMRGQIRGLAQADRNIGDAISLLQTGEGALSQVHGMLQRVRELAVQYKNGSMATADRTAIQSEVNQLASEISRIGAGSKFNGISLLGASATLTFQIGANDGDSVSASTIDLAATLGTAYAALGASSDLAEIDAAIDAVSGQRSSFGALQNRLGFTQSAQKTYHQNLVAAESRIRDVDFAAEITKLTKNQILAQAGIAMLAQANQQPQMLLQLLR